MTIKNGTVLLVVPEKLVGEFKGMLVDDYEERNEALIKKFLKDRCWQKMSV